MGWHEIFTSWLPAWYTALSKIPLPECQYYEDTVVGPLFVLVDYYPVLMSATSFIIMLYRAELMFKLLTLCMTFDVFSNWILRELIIKMPSRFDGCGNRYEMPSFASQHLAFITFILHYIMLRRRGTVNTNLLIMIHLMLFGGLLARVYIGINTNFELFIGTITGIVQGIITTPLIEWIIGNREKILKWCRDTGYVFLFIEDTIFVSSDYLDDGSSRLIPSGTMTLFDTVSKGSKKRRKKEAAKLIDA